MTVRLSKAARGLHACAGCGVELDGDDTRARCEDCEPDAGDVGGQR